MLNQIVVMGRLTRTPELKHTDSQIPVCRFSVACERDFKNDKGEKDVDFFDVVAWRSTAEFVTKYFAKGRMIVVLGRLQIRDWTDKEGNKRRATEIIAESVYFGDSKPSGNDKAEATAETGGFQIPDEENAFGSSFSEGATPSFAEGM